ncbi:hypothetical protein QQ008_10495 [Fulvivirgaceae bacterium BMA10]|uniref:Uncharacterized protein n=1 Tax=Splendidivirga corallicola TaxID=3051826 RepID=A0ABT8KM45_9BACT|nr:hypothetical protein [Fulvivirgaceae bacterium BMA10]
MRNLLLIAFFLVGSAASAQDVIEKIAKGACDCLDEVDDSADINKMQMELGLCIIKIAQPYEKELKEQHNFDFSAIDGPTGERLGQMVGIKMATLCPDVLMKLSSAYAEDESNEEEQYVYGKIKSIEDKQFVTFHLEDSDGKMVKLLWLDFFPNSNKIASKYETLLNKDVDIYYKEQELFDPRIKEYIKFKVITDIVTNEK